ncbi:MAG: acetylglutamate kinase [Ignavibacteria bacterium]
MQTTGHKQMISKLRSGHSSAFPDLDINGSAKNIIVVKYGGAAMENYSLSGSFADDVKRLKSIGLKIVIIHGGGKEVSAMSDRLSIPVRFAGGLRYTDSATMEVVQMVLVGLTNKKVVSSLNKKGVKCIGLCGIDGELFKVKKLSKKNQDLGYVGKINNVNTGLIFDLLANDYIPVIAPVGTNKKDETYNINADDAASKIAIELKAEKLFYISDVSGIEVNGNILNKIDVSSAKDLIKRKIITNGMIPKLTSAFESLDSGVKQVHLINGSVEHSLLGTFMGLSNGTEISGSNKDKNKKNFYNRIKKAS